MKVKEGNEKWVGKVRMRSTKALSDIASSPPSYKQEWLW